jgi:predicted dehydrogenase
MKIAIVGCGFVADYYMLTLANHPELELAGVYDRAPEALQRFSRHFGVRAFDSLDALLAEPGVELVLNLTNPASHHAVSKAALEAGRHVYSEKPLAMSTGDAAELVVLAGAAPCSYLSSAAATVRDAIGNGSLGEVKLVYAEMEDSMVFRENYRGWTSPSGAPWPAEDEFAVGATLEHAGYFLTWLCAFFGPVEQMTAFATRLFDDKGTGQPPSDLANDLSVTCLTFRSGVVARLTCGLAMPRDRSLHIVGSEGVLSLTDGWDNQSPVHLRSAEGHWASRPRILGKVLRRLERGLPLRHWFGNRLPVAKSRAKVPGTSSRMDFALGPADLARSIAAGRPHPHGGDFALHVTELALVAQHADRYPMPYRPTSSFSL